MDDGRIKYFAYGSNMNPRRMESRGVDVYSMKPAVLKDFELLFNKLSSSYHGEGFANIQKNHGSMKLTRKVLPAWIIMRNIPWNMTGLYLR